MLRGKISALVCAADFFSPHPEREPWELSWPCSRAENLASLQGRETCAPSSSKSHPRTLYSDKSPCTQAHSSPNRCSAGPEEWFWTEGTLDSRLGVLSTFSGVNVPVRPEGEQQLWGNTHPEDIVDEKPWEKQAGDLEAGQADEGDHGDTETHGQGWGGDGGQSGAQAQPPSTRHSAWRPKKASKSLTLSPGWGVYTQLVQRAHLSPFWPPGSWESPFPHAGDGGQLRPTGRFWMIKL